jgi:8-oxo-dGTP pyrophosphatase MutT (NUDIX family)
VASRLALLARLLPDYAATALSGFFGHRVGSHANHERLVVQGVVLGTEGVVLTVRRDLRGWELPGGNLEPGESEATALRREIREETGLDVDVGVLVGEYRRSGFLPHRARVYHCRAIGGRLRPSKETPVVRWWNPMRPPSTLFPWYRGPLADALADRDEPVLREERLGIGAIARGMQIDLRMRASGDAAD